MTAILIIGALGYIKEIAPLSRAFLVLVVVVLFLKSGGVFQQFTAALSQTQQAGTIGKLVTGLTTTNTPQGAVASATE